MTTETKGLYEKLNLMDSLNQHVKDGHIIITRPGMLSQDYQTADGRLIVTEKRIGGGYSVGRTLTHISIDNEPPRAVSLSQAYYETILYLELEE